MRPRRDTPYLLILIPLLLTACSQPDFSETAWQQQVEALPTSLLYAPHQEDGLFFTPWLVHQKSIGDLLRWKLSFSQDYSEEEENYLPARRTDTLRRIEEAPTSKGFIIWLGHDSFLIRCDDQVWLLDPMFSQRALVPKRKTDAALSAEEINATFSHVSVIISHNHYDHLDKTSIKALSSNTTFYVPLGLGKNLRRWQPEATIIELDWWQRLTLPEGGELHCLPAQHWSKRAFDDRNSSLWASYMLILPQTTIYFGGDSGYFPGYREFGRLYPHIDFALLPVTAYHPRWFMHFSHMNAEEALMAFEQLKATTFIPTQWGTFRLGDNPPGYPALDLQRIIENKGLDKTRYLFPAIGELIPL